MTKTSIDIFTGSREQPTTAAPFVLSDDAKLSRELFDAYRSARKNWADQVLDDRAFRNGAQWTRAQIKELKKNKQNPIVVNVIQPAVEQAIGMLTSNKPRFSSAAREDSDVKTGRMFSELLTYIWDQSDGNVMLKKVIDDYYVAGMGVLQAYYDPYKDFGKGEICLLSVDPLDVYIDPNSTDVFCRDAANIIIARKLTKEQVMSAYPLQAEAIKSAKRGYNISREESSRIGLEGQTDVFTNINAEQYDVIDRYTKIRTARYRIFDNGEENVYNDEQYAQYLKRPAFILQTASGETQFITKKADAEQAGYLFNQTGGIYHYSFNQQTQQNEIVPGPEDESAVPGSTTKLYPTTVGEVAEQAGIQVIPILENRIRRILTVGDVTIYDDVMEIDEYPIVPFMNRHMRNPYPMSDVRFVRPIQEYVNKIRSLIIAHASNSTNLKVMLPRGANNVKEIEEKLASAGAAVIEFDPEIGQPMIGAPAALPNELYKNEADARKDVQEILGIFPLMQGDSSQAPNTFKGTMQIDEFGQRRIRSKKDDIEAALTQMARVMVQMIQQYYTEHKVIRLLAPNHEAKELAINVPLYDESTKEIAGVINDVTVGKYDVVVVSGSMLPNNRWARFEYYSQLFQMGVIDQVELLKQTDVADIEGVLNRQSQMLQLQQQVQSLTEELKKTKGDLQTAQRESVQDRKRVEVEKFKSKLNKEGSRVEMATQLFQARSQDKLRELSQTDEDGNTRTPQINISPMVDIQAGDTTNDDFVYP